MSYISNNFILLIRYYLLSIYIKKNVCLSVCLSVRYTFSPCNSYDHQTFHDSFLDPGEGRRPLFSEKKSILRLLQAAYVTDQ